ncbi:ABC transporter substrate-binding protein [Hymenobacter properus]|uniref:ABC transporter substrate-binding protein n=1 Tax=Hymenobacter properus TaxID=2791026 RepID=A0A931BH91_9BACT|nr:ABC transporter substrate-binding protein [Hymenobacter properus]MBF9142247.1 ABC transporter substrate-binding protein [Hymenobacter properus]MBR7721054.1 ABC transporter substrate-binding protein [Microvirga sp. SRT04]
MAPFLARWAGFSAKWFGLSAGLLTLAGCHDAARPAADERRVFRYNQPEALSSLDPAFARNQANWWAVNQLYSGLVELDSTLLPAPALARRYSISPDGRLYTFVLRRGVRFHDSDVFAGGKGREVKAADFVYSFKRILDAATASTGGWIFRGKILEKPDGSPSDTAFVAANDSTLRIHLKEPFVPFLGILTMPYAYVVPHEAVEKYGKDFREHPVGTGPFRFKLWDEGNVLLYERNPDYWRSDEKGRKLPYLDAVAISFLPDRKTEFLTFMQGKLDFLSGIRAGSRDLIMHPDGTIREDFKGKFTVQKVPYLNTEYLGIQLDSANLTGEQAVQGRALRDKRVRQALNYALNKPEMLTYLLNRVGTAGTSGFVPKALPSFSEKEVPGYTYQPQKARQLLRAAGYGPQRPLKLRLSTVLERKEIGEYLQKQWADVGVQVQIDINQSAAQQDLVDNGRVAFFAKSWLGDYPDAENYLALFYSPNFSPAGPDKTHFKNAAYDQLYDQARRTQDVTKRTALYQAMDRIVVEESPVISLYYDEVVRLTQNNVRGLTPNPMNTLLLERVHKD